MRGEYFALAFRRGITHGWPAMLVLPLLVAGGVLAWDHRVRRLRRPDAPAARPWPILLCALLGVASHPALDWMNIYGMRWGLPWSGAWTYGDALYIIDPWVWLLLGGAVYLDSRPVGRNRRLWALLALACATMVVVGMGPVGAMVWLAGLAGLLALDRRRRAGSPLGAGAVRLSAGGMAVLVVYLAVMATLDSAGRSLAAQVAMQDGLAVDEVLVAPTPGRPLAGDVTVRTPDRYVRGTLNWLATPRLRWTGEVVPRVVIPDDLDSTEAGRIIEVARRRDEVRDYLTWTRYPYVHVSDEADGWSVRFGDVRYDRQPEAGGLSGITVRISRTDLE